jgi:hypothetical protein
MRATDEHRTREEGETSFVRLPRDALCRFEELAFCVNGTHRLAVGSPMRGGPSIPSMS